MTIESKTKTPTRRDLQRIALKDLVALATECAGAETQLELKLQQSIEQADKEFQNLTWDIDDRLRTLKEKIGIDYRQRIAEIDGKTQEKLKALRANEEKARNTAELDYRNGQRDLKKNLDQAVWLAESVFEAAANQLKEEMKKTDEAMQIRMGEVESHRTRGLSIMATYGLVPAPEVEAPEDTPTPEKPLEAYTAKLNESGKLLNALESMPLPQSFVGVRPILYGMFVLVIAGVAAWFIFKKPIPLLISLGVTLMACFGAGIALRLTAMKQVKKAWIPTCLALHEAMLLSEAEYERLKNENRAKYHDAQGRRDNEVQVATDSHNPRLETLKKRRDEAVGTVTTDTAKQIEALQAQYKADRAAIEQWKQEAAVDLQERYTRDQQMIADKRENLKTRSKEEYEQAWKALEKRLAEGIEEIQAPIEEKSDRAALMWDDPAWNKWTPTKTFASTLRLGQLAVDLKKIADEVPRKGELKLRLPEPFMMTATLGFPSQASLLIQTDRDGREEGMKILQMAMARLLTSLPAGRVRFTILDPVGLGQNFAGFMHLADHDDALVGGRIWTETDQIQQRLADLTEHMETVIQKYLRNEYETIDEYNEQAGELAEPYRFLVIADFPTSFEAEACKRLSSIAASGARCGVYTLVLQDLRQSLPSEMRLEELESHSVVLSRQDGKFAWKDEVFSRFELAIDPPPSEEWLTRTMDVVGRHAKQAKRVEVSFDAIAPNPKDFWTMHSNQELVVPVGRMGATRLQNFKLGRGVAQHALIAGKTGSGKSTLLHAIVTNLAMWYRPDEVEFYLVDFKKGVEFKTYATHMLPHAKAIAVESDREFGLSVLQRLDAELTRRGNLYRKAGVQDIASYRAATGEAMPRVLLIIDEYQEFFTEDDKLSQDSALLIDRLVRQGRAFGVHVLLGSQTIGGSAGLSRATLGQMAVRIALQTSDADSQLILGDGNAAARLLSRPGEAIYNDNGGLVEANSPFQVAWLPDDRKEVYLDAISEMTRKQNVQFDEPIVFEGNAPADIRKNKPLLKRIADKPIAPGSPAMGWIGDPVAIKDPTGMTFRRQSGVNSLMIGQQDEQAVAIMVSVILSLAAQHARGAAKVFVLDGNPADSPLYGVIYKYASMLPIEATNVEYRGVEGCMEELSKELEARKNDDNAAVHQHPAIYVFVAGLQRYRMLRKGEDDFSFGSSDEPAKPKPDKQFMELLRDGPAMGIHMVIWVDTPASFERTMDRSALREFDNRILFQMSANDSSNLIDSPAANKLGFHRALSYSEEQGVLEKFRPYSLPEKDWFEGVIEQLKKR